MTTQKQGQESRDETPLTGEHSTVEGQNAHASKLTDEQAKEIFFTQSYRGVGAALARAYGVSETVISGIRNGSRWKGLK